MTLRSFSLGSECLSSRWVTARPAYEAPSTTTVLAMVVGDGAEYGRRGMGGDVRRRRSIGSTGDWRGSKRGLLLLITQV